MEQTTSQRLKNNKNLTVYMDSSFKGLKVNNNGPLIKNYLARLHSTIEKSLSDYSRTFALRFDLRYPTTFQDASFDDGVVIKTFIDSLKAQIKADRLRIAKDKNKRLHDTKVRYVWCKEVEKSKHCHFHVLLLLNSAAYNTIGKIDSINQNIAGRITTAWERALNKHSTEPCNITGLVEFPPNGSYLVHRDDKTKLNELFYRASYLCKSRGKQFGDGKHYFGSSRL